MLRWLIRMGLLYIVTRLAREYLEPARQARTSSPRAKPRKRKRTAASSTRSR
jgi:hypothetical protein